MAQVLKEKPRKPEAEEVEVEAKDLRKDFDIDDVLDDIDGVLEENAEEFVSQYIQKGGE